MLCLTMMILVYYVSAIRISQIKVIVMMERFKYVGRVSAKLAGKTIDHFETEII